MRCFECLSLKRFLVKENSLESKTGQVETAFESLARRNRISRNKMETGVFLGKLRVWPRMRGNFGFSLFFFFALIQVIKSQNPPNSRPDPTRFQPTSERPLPNSHCLLPVLLVPRRPRCLLVSLETYLFLRTIDSTNCLRDWKEVMLNDFKTLERLSSLLIGEICVSLFSVLFRFFHCLFVYVCLVCLRPYATVLT